MAMHKIFLSSGNFFPQKMSYLDVTEFANVHTLISSKYSFFPKQEFMEEQIKPPKTKATKNRLLRLVMEPSNQ